MVNAKQSDNSNVLPAAAPIIKGNGRSFEDPSPPSACCTSSSPEKYIYGNELCCNF